MKKLIKKIVPESLVLMLHKSTAVLANIVYRFPSRKLIIIGVTGTKGKTTTCNMIWQILTTAGHKTGMTTTANIRIADKEWINDSKMTMQGRFWLQKIIRQMVKAGCKYAVIETSSEGIKQFRHWGIKYQVAVFTNLTPEHIESHGSFDKYREAKAELFKNLSGQSISVLNSDDDNFEFFKAISAKEYIYYGLKKQTDLQPVNIKPQGRGFEFELKGRRMQVSLPGEFNLYNALAAIAVAKSQNVNWQDIASALVEVKYVPGRMEEIKSDKGFKVIVDYAHTPESLEAVYQTLKPRTNKLIAVLGSCGGGRDRAKRPRLGALAGQYADIVIVTNEDPYDENPESIIEEVWNGLVNSSIEKYKIVDRKEAIAKAIKLANSGDIIALTGKGSEQWLITAKGKISWDDRNIVKELLKN